MVGNPCLPFVVPMNEAMRLQMKLDCHVHACSILCTDTSGMSLLWRWGHMWPQPTKMWPQEQSNC